MNDESFASPDTACDSDQARRLGMLYDLALAVGGEVHLRPLLSRVLQRLLLHTGFPTAVALRRIEREADPVLLQEVQAGEPLPASPCSGAAVLPAESLGQGIAWLRGPAVPFAGYASALVLPVAGFGAIVLLGPEGLAVDQPFAESLSPVLANLARAIGLCEKNAACAVDLEQERTSSRHSLELQDRRLHGLMNAIPEVVWLKDPDGVFLYCNPRFEDLYGASEADIVGKTDYDFVGRELADFFRVNDRRAMERREPSINEEWLSFARTGYRGLFETTRTPMFDSDGRLIGVLGVAHDVSAARANQAELAKRMRELSCLYDIFRLSGQDDLDEAGLMRAAADSLVAAMRYPEQVSIRIETLAGTVVAGNPGEPGSQMLSACDCAAGCHCHVTVAYVGEFPEGSGAAFLDQEQALLDTVARRLGGTIVRRRVEAERRAADQALADDHERRRVLIDQSREGIAVIDDEHRIIEANPKFAEMHGYDAGEIVGLHTWDLNADLDEAAVRREFGGKVQVDMLFEARHRRKDGTVFDIEISGSGATVGGRNVAFLVCRDIGQRKRAEAQMRKLSLAVEQSPNAIMMTDIDGRIDYVNEAFTRISGYARDEVIGRKPDLLRSGKTPPETYADLWRTVSAGGRWQGEFVNRGKDGREFIERALIVPLRQPDGRISGYVGVKEDITEQRLAEESLRKLSLAVEQSPASIVVTDLDANIEYVNGAFLRATGFEREEVLGRNPRLLNPAIPTRGCTRICGAPWNGAKSGRASCTTGARTAANMSSGPSCPRCANPTDASAITWRSRKTSARRSA